VGLTFQKLHPCFAAAVSPIDLRQVHDPASLAEIRAGMDEYAVLVFHDQPYTDEEQLAFARRLDGELHTKTGARVLVKSRLGNETVADISNLDADGGIMQSGDRRRMYSLGDRLWHTDASFQEPPGRYSMLSAKVVPSVAADTEFADTRAAYDALDAEMKPRLENLRVHHSIAHSRQTLGFEFSADEAEALKGAIHPLIRTLPRSKPARALRRLARLPHRRLAGARGTAAPARPDRARDPARVRLPSRLARRRPGDLGQPRHDAPRDGVRRRRASSRAAPRHHARHSANRLETWVAPEMAPHPPRFGAPGGGRGAPRST
jgi:alpha-ketoglutarate-dependent 2,4-dichlorophenoxyacetate dioxygenase